MTTMNVSLPSELKSYVDEQVGDGGYGSTSEYVRDLIRRDKDRGNRFLFLEMKDPSAATLKVEIAFTLRRQPVHVALAASSCGEINDSHRRLFAEELAIDAAHMNVTSDVLRIVTEVCGGERNVVVQAQKLLHYVADSADHYSKDTHKLH